MEYNNYQVKTIPLLQFYVPSLVTGTVGMKVAAKRETKRKCLHEKL